ncbi:MAG: hypothetical protein OES33_12785, partial [Desulfobulbaceae bacterium]|nr:hypothetical protein [Desulfobulbaceae bacterium]
MGAADCYKTDNITGIFFQQKAPGNESSAAVPNDIDSFVGPCLPDSIQGCFQLSNRILNLSKW